MSNYKTEQRELEKAINGANDLVCVINTVGDAMNSGGSDAGGYVGAVNVLAQTVKTLILDLKAMHLRMSQYDKARTAGSGNIHLLNTMTDALSEADIALERAETLMCPLAEDYFNENANNPKTTKGQQNIIANFDESRIHAQIVRDYLHDLRNTLNAMRMTVSMEYRTDRAITDSVKISSIANMIDVYASLDSIRNIASHFIGNEDDSKGTASALYFIEQTATMLCNRISDLEAETSVS